MEDGSKLIALEEIAKMQVEIMEKIIKEGHNNLFADGILEGWNQALRAIKRVIEID